MSDDPIATGAAQVDAFLEALPEARQRADSQALRRLLEQVTGEAARLWPGNLIGCGDYHYHYASGRQGDTFLAGFAPRKGQLVLYLTGDTRPHEALFARLGKHRRGVSCIYIKRLEEVDAAVLRELVGATTAALRAG